MYSSVHIMQFRTGVPLDYDEKYHGPGFRLEFEQLKECPTRGNPNDTSRRTTSEEYDDDLTSDVDELPNDQERFSALY